MKHTVWLTAAAFAAFVVATVPVIAQAAPSASLMKTKSPTSASSMKPGAGDEKSFPDQAAVAVKTLAFGNVPAAEVAKAKALDAHDLAPGEKLVGKSGSFQGVVAKVYKPENNGRVILDFDEQYKTAMTATVLPDDYAKFPDLNTLLGKHVFVTGTFSDYKGRAVIEMTKPAQVRVIK